MITSLAAASAGLTARAPYLRASASAFAASLPVTSTRWPARVSCLTRPEPILPEPMTVMFMDSSSGSDQSGLRLAPFALVEAERARSGEDEEQENEGVQGGELAAVQHRRQDV